MKGTLKYVDMRLAVIIGVILILTVLGRVVLLSHAGGVLGDARLNAESAAQELEDIESRIASIRAQGSDNLQEVITKVGIIEQQLSASLDELTLTVVFDAMASASGVSLTEFSKPSKVETRKAGDILAATAYDFSITGSYADAVDFIERVIGAPPFLATFDSVSIRNQQSGRDSSGELTIFTRTLTVNGRVLLWSLTESPVVSATPSSVAQSSETQGTPADPNTEPETEPTGNSGPADP